jgi:hypothetical protein
MSNKEKDQFKKRFSSFRIEEAELDRMFHQEELRRRALEVNEAAFQAAMAAEAMRMGYGAVPGGPQISPTPTPTSELAEATLIYWEDATTGTWKFFVHNYGTNISSDIVDTGLDYTDYSSIDNGYIVEQAGFSWQATDNTAEIRAVFCVSPDGTVIESFTYPLDGLDGRRNFEYLTHVWWWVDGSQTNFRIFNGSSVESASLPFAVSSGLSFNSSAGETSKNRTISFKVDNTTSYVLTAAGNLVDVTSEIGNNYTNSTSLQSDFICFINRDGSSVPQSVVIVNEDGTVRNTFDLTALTVNSINEAGVYGENQWSGMFQESPGDWVWVKYDYTSDTFSTETRPYTNYDNINRYQDFRETTDSFDNYRLNSVNALYSGDVAATWGTDYDYLTFLWSIGSGGTYQEDVTVGTPIEILYAGETMFSDYPSFLAGPVGGTGFINVGILTDTGTIQYAPTGQLSQNCASASSYLVGNTSMFVFGTTGGDTRFEFWNTAQVQTHTIVGSTNWTYFINGSTLVAINNDDYNDSFWYAENFPTINAMPALTSIQHDYTQSWGSLTGVAESEQIFWEINGNSQGFAKLYILTNDGGLSSEITGNDTPAELDLDLEKGVFNWIYEDETSGNVIISQYSLSTGSILSTVDTGVTSLGGSNWSSYGIRSLVWADDTPAAGSVTLWLQGPSGTTTSVIETSNWDYSHNDSEWDD